MISVCDHDVMRPPKNGNVVIVDMNKVFSNATTGSNTLKYISTIENYINDNIKLTGKCYGPKRVKPSVDIYNNGMDVLWTYFDSERNSAMDIFLRRYHRAKDSG